VANRALKRLRQNPNVLMAGDRVTIPGRRQKEVDVEIGKCYRIKTKGVPEKLILKFMQDGEPRAQVPYTLTVDDEVRSGTTDGEGKIEEWIDPRARECRLVIGEGAQAEKYDLQLRHLDPVTEPSGVNSRLMNLGYLRSNEGDRITAGSTVALRLFQEEYGLSGDGQLTDETRNKLVEVHGC
jgi:hypothetical protein